MADAVSHTSKPKILPDHANPSKYFTHFLYKAALVTVFLVLLPLFPSLAPEFINQTLHARSWELLQLIFVGIAVSYGLFSKKNDEMDKEYHHTSKVDNAQSYVSKLLQVSSVFDDESETQTVIDENSKVQTWSSQYYRGEPVVVVAKENPTVVKDENSSTSVTSEITQKPLLLPVRSLKQRVSDPIEVDLADDSGGSNLSNSGSKRFSSSSRKSRIGEIGGLNVDWPSEEKLEENVVLRSPIPWRSRSGKLEMKENRSNSSSMINSPRKLSRSTSFSSQSQTKNSEDVVRKKNSPSLSPPPPPPPPPPRKSVQNKSTSNVGPTSILENDGNLGRSVRRFRSFNESIIEKKEIEEKKEMAEKVLMETSDDDDDDDESELEDDYFEESGNNSVVNDDVGPDVDKKADEFIAKFREQIRLQRIESIRRTTAQRAGRTFR